MTRQPDRPTPPLTGDHVTVADAFEAAAEQHGDRLAYVDGSVRLSFAEWFRRSDEVAASLVHRGVQPGDVIALLLPSTVDYAVAYGAIVLAGAVATGVNNRLGRREIDGIIDRARPVLAVRDHSTFPSAPSGVPLCTLDDLTATEPVAGLGATRPQRSPDDAAVIIWTSGTTGSPKGAWFDHDGLRAAVASAGVMSEPYDVKLVGIPFPHAGYAAKLWDQLAWGTTSVLSPTPWSATDMLRLFAEEKITVAGGVPTQWAKLLVEPGLADLDLSTLRVGLVASAPASPELIGAVTEALGCALVVRYAMTEAPSISGTEIDDSPEVQYRTVGRAQRGMEVSVVDSDGEIVADGSVGRIRVRGACVMRGYWNDETRTAAAFDADGWLVSSDLGRIDAGGNLVLAGREDDMYPRGGYNVYPLEVENVLEEHEAVARAAIVGTPAPTIGEVGVAFVVAENPERPPTLRELREWVGEKLADYKRPDRLVVLPEIPMTAMMKIDRGALAPLAAHTIDDRENVVDPPANGATP